MDNDKTKQQLEQAESLNQLSKKELVALVMDREVHLKEIMGVGGFFDEDKKTLQKASEYIQKYEK